MSATAEQPADGLAELDDRHCVVCDSPLGWRRGDARHCSDPCRAEAARWRAILDGRDGIYRSLRHRLSARGRGTARLLRKLDGQPPAE